MKIGILTFHTPNNYGAVLQAYALQHFLLEQGNDCEIIDFDRPKQRYSSRYIVKKNGVKRTLKSLILFRFMKKRKERDAKFQEFRERKLHLSSNKFENECDLYELNDIYDAFVVGSDQIWNTKKNNDFSTAYLLDFVSDNNKKIAYAPSVGTADVNDLGKYKELLCSFNHLSCRESGGAEILKCIVGKDVMNVIDPTLLVNNSVFDQLVPSNYETGEKYLLYYSLNGYDKRNQNIDLIEYIAQKLGLSIKYLTPEWPIHKNGEDIMNAGPIEFLNLIKNASLVCATSFHGTALSISYNIPFFVLEDRNVLDERKRSLLMQLGIEDRIVSCINDFDNVNSIDIDFELVNDNVDKLRQMSKEYLIKAINE